MPIQSENLLCRYQYDPVDRLTACSLSTQSDILSIQRFYLKDRLVTEIESELQRSIVQYEDQLFAQHERYNETVGTTLLITDQQRSVLNVVDTRRHMNLFAYTPYGHRSLEGGLLGLLGFNGERPDPLTGYYMLGNGYRAFDPVLMRFNSPDNLSPFGKGGLNPYAYCLGDPVNREDRTGHIPALLKPMLRSFGIIKKSKVAPNVAPVSPPGKMSNTQKLVSERSLSEIEVRPKQVFAESGTISQLKAEAMDSGVSRPLVLMVSEKGRYITSVSITHREESQIRRRFDAFQANTVAEKSIIIRQVTGFSDRSPSSYQLYSDIS